MLYLTSYPLFLPNLILSYPTLKSRGATMAYVSNWLSQVWGGGQDASVGNPPALNASPMELSCPNYKIEAGLDYVGGDIGTGPTTVNGDVACCMLCESTTACNAFTFVLATSECWLKVRRRAPRRESQPGALVSGYRPHLKRGTRALTRFGGGGALAGRPLVGQRRGAAAAVGGGAGSRAAAGRWQQERQAGLLLQRAAPLWQDRKWHEEPIPTPAPTTLARRTSPYANAIKAQPQPQP